MKTTQTNSFLIVIFALACFAFLPSVQAAKPTPTPAPSPTATWGLNGTSAYYNNGNVGIGTSSPSNALSVLGAADFSTSILSPVFAALPGSGNSVSLRANDTTDTQNGGSVNITAGNSMNASPGGTVAMAAGAYGGLTGARIDLRSYTLGGDVVLSTTSRGTLGGSTVDVRPPPDNLTCGSVVLSGGSSDSATGGPIILNAGNGGGDPFYQGGKIVINAGSGSAGSANGTIQLQIGGADVLRVDPSGNVGIGTTAPTATLDVNGDVAVSGDATIAGIPATAVAGQAVFVDANGQLGVTGSSARFKEDIKPMDQKSEAILSLRPVTFKYKKQMDAKGRPQFGLIAEEVEKVDPDLVLRDAEGKPYTVRYEAVNAMMLNELIKEHRIVEEQQKQIEKVSAQLKEQASMLQKVSAQMELMRSTPSTVAKNQ